MIEPPPLLTIRRRFARPSKAVLAAFAGVPISQIADAQRGRGGLDHRIQPVTDAPAFVGPALTAWCGPGDNLAALAALELARPGDVIVIACDAFDGAGVIGDRFAAMARNRRIGGIVVDGLVRDRPGIRAAGVPCLARGATATSACSSGPGEVGVPVVIGSVPIESGDLVAADADGVIVVPRRQLAAVLSALAGVRENEARVEQAIADGATGFDWVRELMSSPGTRYLD